MGRHRARVLIAVVCLAAAAACARSEQTDGPGSVPPMDMQHLSLSGVSFGLPKGWLYCELPGPVVFGRLVQAQPPDWDEGFPPLVVQVNEGTKSYAKPLELDVGSLGPDAGVTTEEVEVPGAAEATMRAFEGTVFGQEVGGMLVYASDGEDTTVKVGWTSVPEAVEGAQPVFDEVVGSIELGSEEPTTGFETCDEPVPPTPRPKPDTEDVLEEIEGAYWMTITQDQVDESEHLTATDPRRWALALEGDELRLVGKTDTRDVSFTVPILEASSTQLVLEASDCDNPAEPMDMTMSFVVDDRSLEVLDLEPVCDETLREIFTINPWQRAGG